MNRQQAGRPPHTSHLSMPRLVIPHSSMAPSHEISHQSSSFQAPPSSPGDPPHPSYPIPIPPEKQDKALRLYKEYCLAIQQEGLDQRQQQTPAATHGYLLGVPSPTAPRSAKSHNSSKYHGATSVSTFDETELTESVMSFEGDESPSSARARNYNGIAVKQHVRKRLGPKAKAKAALVRWLGSCWVCRKRAVSCPLEHYDIGHLERLKAASQQQSSSHPRHLSRNSLGGSMRRKHRLASVEPAIAGSFQSQALIGLGQNEELLDISGPLDSGPLDLTQLDISSPIGNLGDFSGPLSVPPPLYQGAQTFGPNTPYQSPRMFPLGNFCGGLYHCQNFEPPCYVSFLDLEALETHFEQAHFSYTRINPAYRYLCPSSKHMNNMNGACQSCSFEGEMDIWIYGNQIGMPSFQRNSSDGHDQNVNTPTSASYYSVNYPPPTESQGDPAMENGSFNGSPHPGNYYRQDDAYDWRGSSNPDFGNYQYTNSGSSASRFQGGAFRAARCVVEKSSNSLWTASTKTPRGPKYLKTLCLALLLFFLVTLGFTYECFFANVRLACPQVATSFRTHLPAIGFISIVASFLMYSSMKNASNQPVLRTQCPLSRCSSLCRMKLFPIACRQTAPDTFIHGGMHS